MLERFKQKCTNESNCNRFESRPDEILRPHKSGIPAAVPLSASYCPLAIVSFGGNDRPRGVKALGSRKTFLLLTLSL